MPGGQGRDGRAGRARAEAGGARGPGLPRAGEVGGPCWGAPCSGGFAVPGLFLSCCRPRAQRGWGLRAATLPGAAGSLPPNWVRAAVPSSSPRGPPVAPAPAGEGVQTGREARLRGRKRARMLRCGGQVCESRGGQGGLPRGGLGEEEATRGVGDGRTWGRMPIGGCTGTGPTGPREQGQGAGTALENPCRSRERGDGGLGERALDSPGAEGSCAVPQDRPSVPTRGVRIMLPKGSNCPAPGALPRTARACPPLS